MPLAREVFISQLACYLLIIVMSGNVVNLVVREGLRPSLKSLPLSFKVAGNKRKLKRGDASLI